MVTFYTLIILNSDLPDDTPVVDLHKLAGLDERKLPKMEKSGEHLLCDVKEWMLKERSSAECAVLPKDKIQCIMVRVSNFTELKIKIFIANPIGISMYSFK